MIQQDSEGQALWGAPEPQPDQRPSAPKRKKNKRRCGGRSIVRPRRVLQDEPTNGKNDGEKSCMSDFKRRTLAKGKLVFILCLFHPFFNIFFAPYLFFSTACLKFSKLFSACWNFSSTFFLKQKYQKHFSKF